MRLEAGDRVLAVETDRGILLTPYDPEAERALTIAAKAAKKYRNAVLVFGETGVITRSAALRAIQEENADGRGWRLSSSTT